MPPPPGVHCERIDKSMYGVGFALLVDFSREFAFEVRRDTVA
jgi:hypothetical protein